MSHLDRDRERIRQAVGVIAESSPDGPDFEELHVRTIAREEPSPGRRALVPVIGALAALAIILPVATLMSDSGDVGSTAPLPSVVSLVPGNTVLATGGAISSVHTVPETGDLVGLRDQTVWRSTDDGISWAKMIEVDDFDLLDIAPDGAVIAVRNPTDVVEGALAPGSRSNATPEVHRWDPITESWSVYPLPRPLSDVVQPTTGNGCEDNVREDWVAATSIASDLRIVIDGWQNVTTPALCNGTAVFQWLSEDGMTWVLTYPTDDPGVVTPGVGAAPGRDNDDEIDGAGAPGGPVTPTG